MSRWKSFDTFLAETRQKTNDGERQELVDKLLAERTEWPWVEGKRATFIFNSPEARKSVALNLDTIKTDPPFARMAQIQGTSLWYVTREFENDDLLDYLLAVDDPMTPLSQEKNIAGRVANYWRADPLNPLKMQAAGQNVSVLRMEDARPFPDWSGMSGVPRGQVFEHTINSAQLGFKGRKLSVYTPPDYQNSGLAYPLLILQDGQWMTGPLQVAFIANALIKHRRMQPIVIAMMQSGDPNDRTREYVNNNNHYLSVLTEILPLVQTTYRVDSTNLGIGGVAVGAIAAAHSALMNPAVYSRLIMISPPLGKGDQEEQLRTYTPRFEKADLLPRRIFQSVGRYEAPARFVRPARELADILKSKNGTAYKFVEIGSGHGLVGFRSVLPEALSWVYPP